jgi:hypothetical protein
MKIVIVVLTMVLMASTLLAAPYLVCDPQSGVQTYQLTGPSWVVTTPVSAQVDGSLKYDVASSTVGNNSLTIKACKSDPIWGAVCSTSVPFSFVRPAATLSAPSGLGLVSQ